MLGLLQQNLERVAQCLPNQTAFVCGDDALTWAELDCQATAFAAELQASGVKTGDRVALQSDLSLAAVIAIYGVLKAGAAYVPIDGSAGCERISRVLAECQAEVLVTFSLTSVMLKTLERDARSLNIVVGPSGLPQSCGRVQVLEWHSFVKAGSQKQFVRPALTSRQSAYVIFTSGSTGRPKGIVHTHGSAQEYARLTAETYELSSKDRIACVCPLHFDMSTFGLFAGVFAAATMVLIPSPVLRFPASLSALLSKRHVSVLYCVPYLLIQLLERGVLDQRNWDDLRWVIFAGESFPLGAFQSIRRFWNHVAFGNAYGPAETNVCCIRHFLPWVVRPEPDRNVIPIGELWGDAIGRVVDADDVTVAQGEPGELLVTSSTVMAHYEGRSEDDPRVFYHCPSTGRRYYRTGDLVHQDEAGELVFRGRCDRQVKVRGHRIELDAVENAMTRFPGVIEASVSCVPTPASNELFARYTSRGDEDLDETLDAWLRTLLPAWAVPANIERVDSFDRTSSGKIDHHSTSRRPLNLQLQLADSEEE